MLSPRFGISCLPRCGGHGRRRCQTQLKRPCPWPLSHHAPLIHPSRFRLSPMKFPQRRLPLCKPTHRYLPRRRKSRETFAQHRFKQTFSKTLHLSVNQERRTAQGPVIPIYPSAPAVYRLWIWSSTLSAAPHDLLPTNLQPPQPASRPLQSTLSIPLYLGLRAA